jgi:hypothetical protein
MNGPFCIARFVSLAIILIALALTPSVARAHAGHDHHGVAASSHAVLPAAAAAVTPENSEQIAEWRASPNDSSAGSKQLACNGGCCSGFHCTACSAIIAPESVRMCLFNLGRLFEFPATPPRNGITPGGLRRPPRTFA